VDVVPQAHRLRLALNMPFNDIVDPRGICKDVTDLGRWGNGDVEVGVSSLDDIPYVIGLIRQSLEGQLGNEVVAYTHPVPIHVSVFRFDHGSLREAERRAPVPPGLGADGL
jgi:hypothetical protein